VARFRFAPWLVDWLLGLTGFSFEWDEANCTKNVEKHGVTCEEAEEVFTVRKFVPLGEQFQPPTPEPRYGVLGKTSSEKRLFLVFTLRHERIRVISARRMNERERAFYASLREE
jgi:uncharacterized DUF497 family protein